LTEEGNEVLYYLDPKVENSEQIEELLSKWGIEIVDNFYDRLNEVDAVLFSDSGWGQDIDFLRKSDYRAFGASEEAENLELDKGFQKMICEQYGLKIPESEELEVRDAMEVEDLRVIKIGEETYIPVNGDDYLNYLSNLDENEEVIVEEFIDGMDCSISGFFNGNEFVKPLLINFKLHRLMDGDLGPMTDVMGATAKFVYDSPIVNYLLQLEDYFREIGHKGFVELCCIVNEDEFYVIQIFTGLKSISLNMMLPLIEGCGNVISETIDGNLNNLNISDKNWICGVPLSSIGEVKVYGLEKAENYISPLYREGRLLMSVGIGGTIGESQDDAYRAMDHIIFQGVMYRLDIGDKVDRELENLVEWGVLPESVL
jgi:phosphoribosylamine-glycine ligase